MSYKKTAYLAGVDHVLTKLGLDLLPRLGKGELSVLQDADYPDSMRRAELDSYLLRAISTPVAPEQDFQSWGRTRGLLGGGVLGGLPGAAAGGAAGTHMGGRGRLGALIGAGVGATAGAALGGSAGRTVGSAMHKQESDYQRRLEEVFTSPGFMDEELRQHLQDGTET